MRIPKLIPALLALFVVENAGASAWAADVPSYSPAQSQLLHQASNWDYGYNSGPYEEGGSYYYRRGYGSGYYGSGDYGSDYYGSGYYDGYGNDDCYD